MKLSVTNKFFLLAILSGGLISQVFASGAGNHSDLEGLKITAIQILTKRVSPDYIRKVLPVKEGDDFHAESMERIRRRLNEMRFFKKMDLSFEKDSDGKGVKITLQLEDGWYLFPLPLIRGGGGGSFGSLLLAERNIFKRAESVFIYGGGNRDGGFGAVGFQLNRFLLAANYGNRNFTEWGYADGGFNADGRERSSRSENDPGRFGTIQNQYDRRIESEGFQLRFPWSQKAGTSLGYSSQRITYSNLVTGTIPTDQGTANILSAGLNFTLLNPGASSDSPFSFQDFGAIFGFGMADLSDRIKPLDKREVFSNADISISESDRSLDSDFNYTKTILGLNSGILFKGRERLSLTVRGGASPRENLPLTQKFATNHDLGMRGNYARVFRGDRGAGASLDLSYPFRRTRRGSWTAELFTDAATCWDSGNAYQKEGIGFGLSYRFWRFPLPLGILYSYSLDDKDSQVNFAFGGRF